MERIQNASASSEKFEKLAEAFHSELLGQFRESDFDWPRQFRLEAVKNGWNGHFKHDVYVNSHLMR